MDELEPGIAGAELALALKEFSAHAAHEISNPLNNIGLNAQLALTLLELGRTAEAEELLQRLLKDCWACAREVSSFARLGASLVEPAEPVSVAELLDTLCTLIASRSARPFEQFVCELPPDLPMVRVAASSLNYTLSYLALRSISESMQRMVFSAVAQNDQVRLCVRAVHDPARAEPPVHSPPLGLRFFQRTLSIHGIGLDVSTVSKGAFEVLLPM